MKLSSPRGALQSHYFDKADRRGMTVGRVNILVQLNAAVISLTIGFM
jgi:hypothetical protein